MIDLFSNEDDLLLPSDNIWGIPTLRLDRQPTFCERPFFRYGEIRRTRKNAGSGTLCFYEADDKFKKDTYRKIIKQHVQNVVETNESIYDEYDLVEALMIVRNKRRLSRVLQDMGCGIFVDLNVAVPFAKVNLIGVPDGYGAYCTKGKPGEVDMLEFEYNLAKNKACGQDLTFVVYGGGADCEKFCRERLCIYVEPGLKILGKQKRLKLDESALPIISPEDIDSEIEKLQINQVRNYKEINKKI